MAIPGELTVLLERMFARKIGDELIAPAFEDKVDLYLRALKFVERNPRLFSYVLGHRREVSTAGYCREIDEVLLECACRDPRIIPADFRDRLPIGSPLSIMLERLYKAVRTVQRFDYEEFLDAEPYVFGVAAE